MNVPNTITVARFAASIVLFILLVLTESRDPGWVFPLVGMILFILVVATDALDGYLARKYRQVTDFGRIADPVADKILICGTMIFICASTWGRELLPAWLVILIVAREFLVTGIRGFIEARGIAFPASWSGKFKMIAQSVAVPALFFHQVVSAGLPEFPWVERAARWLAVAVLAVTLVLTVYSGVIYVIRAARILSAGEE